MKDKNTDFWMLLGLVAAVVMLLLAFCFNQIAQIVEKLRD